jgi:hypothetical protein
MWLSIAVSVLGVGLVIVYKLKTGHFGLARDSHLLSGDGVLIVTTTVLDCSVCSVPHTVEGHISLRSEDLPEHKGLIPGKFRIDDDYRLYYTTATPNKMSDTYVLATYLAHGKYT